MNQNDVTWVDNGQDIPTTKKRFNPKIAAAIAGGAGLALITGGVAYAIIPEAEPVNLDMHPDVGSAFNSFPELGTQTPTPQFAPPATGHVFNIHTAPHAHNVNDNMTFDQAFAAARQETGAGGVFVWRGQLYGTFYATEVDANGNPTINYPKVDTYVNNNNVSTSLYTDAEALDDNIGNASSQSGNSAIADNSNSNTNIVTDNNTNNAPDEINEVDSISEPDLNALNDNFTDLQDYV